MQKGERRPPLAGAWEPGLELGSKGPRVGELQHYLRRFGYLQQLGPDIEAAWRYRPLPAAPVAQDGLFDEATRFALKNYQRVHRLPATGVLDEPTLIEMRLSRCGVPDRSVRPAGSPQHIFAVFPTRWRKTDITFGFGATTPDLAMSEIRTAVLSAFALWSAVTPLRFTEAASGTTPDILIQFVTGDHGHSGVFDSAFGTLAHAFPPPFFPGGTTTVCFDDAETWRTTFSVTGWSFDFDLVTVAAHEIGHALGLDHSDVRGSIMWPTIPPGYGARQLGPDDIRGIQSLYVETAGEQFNVCGVTAGGDAWHAKRLRTNWTPFDDLRQAAGNPGPLVTIACAEVADELHVCGLLNDGGLVHTIRGPGGWSIFGDVMAAAASDPGRVSAVSTAGVAGELHVCVVTTDGRLWHTIRHADGWDAFGDVKNAASNPGFVKDVAIAAVAGELHVCAMTVDGGLWHSIRHADRWDAFGDVKAAASDPGLVYDVGAAGLGGELHVCVVTNGGALWHTIRHAAAWDPFGDVKAAASDPGGVIEVACGADALGRLHVACLTYTGALFWEDTHLWHTVRSPAAWEPFTEVEPLTADPGRFVSIGAAATYESVWVAPVRVTTTPA